MNLTRDLIVNSAVDILDAYGIADMTMRRVAKQLSVAPGALYWHVANKQELLSAIAERLLEPVMSAATTGAAGFCRELRAALLSHRDGAELIASALAQPDSALRPAIEDRLSALLGEEGVDDGVARDAAPALLNLLLGASVQEQLRQAFADTPGAGDAASRSVSVDTQVELLLTGLPGRSASPSPSHDQ